MRSIALFSVCLVVAIVPWEENFVIPGLASTARLLGVLAIVLGILKVLINFRLRRPPRAMVWVVLLIGWCLLAMNWSIKPGFTLERAITYTLLLIFMWLIWDLADTPRRQKWIMRAFILGMVVVISNSYLRFVGIGLAMSGEEYRAGAERTDVNQLAFQACFAIQFALFLITRREKGALELPNWFYWGFIAAAGVAVLLTGSRSGILGGAITTAAFFPLLREAWRKSGWKNLAALLLVAVVMAGMASRLVSRAIVERLAEGTESDTYRERQVAWQRGLQAWSQTPLLGVGPATYNFIGSPEGMEKVAHNSFVSLLVESGIIGFLLYFAFWVVAVRGVLRLPWHDRYFWLVLTATVLPCLFSLTVEYHKDLWMLGALMLCHAANVKPAQAVGRRPLIFPVRKPRPASPPRPSGPS